MPVGTNAVVSWLLVLGFWIVGFIWLRRDLPQLSTNLRPATQNSQQNADFREAQHLYLKGHWIEAETLLTRLLLGQPQDVEAQLLLTSVQRRTGRWLEARQKLVALKDERGAANWLPEIESELNQLRELDQQSSSVPKHPPEKAVPRAHAA